jgi:hypothetical protein
MDFYVIPKGNRMLNYYTNCLEYFIIIIGCLKSCWTWKDFDDGVCCTELLGLFWTLSIVLYVEDKKSNNVSETGFVSVFRWMGQDKPTQLGPLERASLNHRFALPHPPEDGDRSSLRNVVGFVVFHIQDDGQSPKQAQ